MKRFIVFFLTLFLTMVYAQFSFQIIIGFGNIPTFSLDNLPDYSVVIFTAEPFADVYIDNTFAGKTDAYGRLIVKFSSEGYHTLWVVSSNQYIVYEKTIFKVEKKPSSVYITPIGLGKVTIFSNTYPVYVYLPNGKGAGVIEKYGDSAVLPVGTYEITLASPGFENIKTQVNVLYAKETPLWLEFKPLQFNLELIVAPEKFSPNGDWTDDECKIKIYSSRKASGVLQIVDFSGKIVYEKKLSIMPGTTEIVWNGDGNKDGTYTVYVLLSDGNVEMKKEAKVTIDTSVYTYRKEISLVLLTLFLAVFGYLIFTSLNR
ncbi:MAG: hypothetical protein N2Z58_06535 [Fervidobacterium sp.]|nr:hypothetical protein [Fervidobacterium sp.]